MKPKPSLPKVKTDLVIEEKGIQSPRIQLAHSLATEGVEPQVIQEVVSQQSEPEATKPAENSPASSSNSDETKRPSQHVQLKPNLDKQDTQIMPTLEKKDTVIIPSFVTQVSKDQPTAEETKRKLTQCIFC
jgi:hypothetical protein